jgi:hypothetical protein
VNYPYFQGTSPPAIAPQQVPYSNQWGYPPTQQPSQNDFIDQATKILNFVEALQQRGTGRATQTQETAQSSTPTNYSVGNFQTAQTQAIGEQERRLAQLATSTPQSLPSTQTNYAPSLQQQSQVSNNLEATLQQQVQVLSQGFQAAMEERNAAFKLIDSLMPFVQVNDILNQENQELHKTVNMLTPFVQTAQIWMDDAIAHEQVLNNVLNLFVDPEFLVYHAFQVFNNKIQHNGQAALEWISDEYLNLLNTYEQRYMAANNGQHSPMWQRMQPKTVTPVQGSVDSQNYAQIPPQFQQQYQQPVLQQPQYQAPPMPPVPGNNGMGGGPIDQLKQRIELMKSGNPNLGQQMQLMHAAQRQAMGVDVF